jgi:hypothetical protein
MQARVLQDPDWAGIAFPRGVAHPISNAVRIMPKSIEQIAEVVQNHRHNLKNVDSRPQKAQKHRYERRKVREAIRLGDWAGDQSQA